MTHSAVRLVAPGALAVASGHAVAGPDWDTSTGRVPHRDLASWPDLVIVAPATTAFIGKLAHGQPDSLALACAMDTSAPVVVAPSLPEGTSRFPPVVRNLRSLAADGIFVVPTIAGVSLDDGVPRRVPWPGSSTSSGTPDMPSTRPGLPRTHHEKGKAMNDELLSAHGVGKTYSTRSTTSTALDDVSLEVRAGDRLAITGRSGAASPRSCTC